MKARAIAALLVSATLLLAAPPLRALAMSHGYQLLPIPSEECARRGAQALASQGYGTPAPALLLSGFKGLHGAYIVCAERPDGLTGVSVFVATENVVDGNLPNTERLRLQERMTVAAGAAAPGASAPASPSASAPAAPASGAGFGGTWETDQGTLTLTLRGTQVTGSIAQPPGTILGSVRGRVLGGQWTQAGRSGRLRFELAADGSRFTGTWTESDGRAGGAWNGTRR